MDEEVIFNIDLNQSLIHFHKSSVCMSLIFLLVDLIGIQFRVPPKFQTLLIKKAMC